MRARALSLTRDLANSITAAWRSWRERRQLPEDLACCDRAEVERVAQEFGLSRNDLIELSRAGPKAAELLERRLLAMRVYPSAPKVEDPLVMRDLQRCCASCDSKRRCKRDLDEGSKALDWQQYCPNAETLNALAGMKRH